jgi:hypothetical protein
LVLLFDTALLGGEAVDLQSPGPGEVPLQLKVRPAVAAGPDNTSGWVYAEKLTVLNSTAIAVTIPTGAPTPTAVKCA